jgi:hypothetical protein
MQLQWWIIEFEGKGYYGGQRRGQIRYIKKPEHAKKHFNYQNAESRRQQLFVLTGIRTSLVHQQNLPEQVKL